MTATTVPRPSRVRPPQPQRGFSHRAVRGVLTAGGLAVLALWWLDTTGRSVRGAALEITAAGSILGLLGAYLVLVQILLLARVPWFERAVGFDRLTSWHRALGTNVVLLLVGHATLVIVGYSMTDRTSVIHELSRIVSTYPHMIEAVIALAIFVAVAVSSTRAARRRLSYEAWYVLHLSVYAAVALAALHQVSAGVDFVGHPVNRALWILLYVAVAGCLLTRRVGTMWRDFHRYHLRIEAVRPEARGVVSVWIRGRHLDEMRFREGQYLLWRFVARGHLLTAHPYSVSAFRSPSLIRVTVKDAGNHSRTLGHLRPGTRVLTEGPFGHFTAAQGTRQRSLLVAGGAGIAPIRALAEALARTASDPAHVVVLYRLSRASDAALKAELDAMAARGFITVHYLVGRRRDLRHDPLAATQLRDLVPDIRSRDVWVCGPAGMTATVIRSLSRLGVPASQVHRESFAL